MLTRERQTDGKEVIPLLHPGKAYEVKQEHRVVLYGTDARLIKTLTGRPRRRQGHDNSSRFCQKSS